MYIIRSTERIKMCTVLFRPSYLQGRGFESHKSMDVCDYISCVRVIVIIDKITPIWWFYHSAVQFFMPQSSWQIISWI